jgi:hypothetical protein
MLDAEAAHRDHALVEQVIAELKAGPLAHLPSREFTANAAWLVYAAIAFTLTRAAGVLVGAFHAKGRLATVRTQLIAIPARIARSARRLRLHLPRDWPWGTAWTQLFDATCGPPAAARPRPSASQARPQTDSGRAGQTGSSPTPTSGNQDQISGWRTGPRSTVDRG